MSQDELQLIEDGPEEQHTLPPWTVLIVDDEQEVHDITLLALSDFQFAQRGLCFLHAYSGAEAAQMVDSHPDIAVMLVDVVMESDHAGLDLVRHVREVAGRRFPRIILRTGQPGQAPERRVIAEYDINDYKQKTELTQEKMFSVMHTSIASYRDLMALDRSRRGLRKVIKASAELFTMESMESFAQGVLEQLCALLYLDDDALVLCTDSLAAGSINSGLQILAGTGRFSSLEGRSARDCLPEEVYGYLRLAVDQAHRSGEWQADGDVFTVTYIGPGGRRHVLYTAGSSRFTPPDQELIDLYCECVAKAQAHIEDMTSLLLRESRSPPL